MSQRMLPKQAMTYTAQGRRAAGRPRKLQKAGRYWVHNSSGRKEEEGVTATTNPYFRYPLQEILDLKFSIRGGLSSKAVTKASRSLLGRVQVLTSHHVHYNLQLGDKCPHCVRFS